MNRCGQKRRSARRGRRSRGLRAGSMAVAPLGGALTPSYGPVCRIQRSFEFQQTPAAAEVGSIWNWSLSDLTSFSDFSNLFLQWKLDAVTVDVTYNAPYGAASGTPPRFLYAFDPLALSSDLTGPNVLLQRKCRVWVPNPTKNTLRITVKPRALMLSTNSSGSAAVVQTLAPAGAWFSTDTSQLSYGNLIAWVENFTTANAGAGVFSHYHTMHMSFRGPR